MVLRTKAKSNESLENKGKEAFNKYVDYLYKLPSFELTKEEKSYIEKISSTFENIKRFKSS